MLDLHLHILANVDDGPASRDESAAMVQLAASLGYKRLVATPHLLEPLNADYVDRVIDEREWLTSLAAESGIAMEAGFEVRVSPDIGARLESLEPITLAGSKTVLIELPFVGWPTYTEQALFDVTSAGFRPLLAHPERYAAALENPSLIYTLHERGVLMQLTTGSLAGLFGKRSREVAEQFLRDGIVDVLASDAHSAGRRFVSVGEGLARANELVGSRRVAQLTNDNPEALLADTPLEAPVIEIIEPHSEPAWRNSFTRVKHLIHRR